MARKKNLKDIDELDMQLIDEKMGYHRTDEYLTSCGLIRQLNATKFKLDIKCKNEKQKLFLKNLKDLNYKLNICDAPAGVGKSLLALTAGLYHIKSGNVDKMIVIVPTVEASEATKIGLLPGSIEEKIKPYQIATQSSVEKILKLSGNADYQQKAQMLFNSGLIEFELLSYARGRTFDNAFIVIDEAENLSNRETLLLLGRMGDGNTKVVLLGDKEQCDRKGLRGLSDCGLVHAEEHLASIDEVSVDKFTYDDIVRNSFITKIFNQW